MDRQYIIYLLIGLLVLLAGSVAMYFVLNARAREREIQRRRDSQAERERMAERRIADNGGIALSARPGSRADPSTVSGSSGSKGGN